MPTAQKNNRNHYRNSKGFHYKPSSMKTLKTITDSVMVSIYFVQQGFEFYCSVHAIYAAKYTTKQDINYGQIHHVQNY